MPPVFSRWLKKTTEHCGKLCAASSTGGGGAAAAAADALPSIKSRGAAADTAGAADSAPTPLTDAAAALIGTHLEPEALDAMAAACRAACAPIDDKRGTKEFRIEVAGVLARRVALLACERAKAGAGSKK